MKDVAFLKVAALVGVSLFVLIARGGRMATPEVRLEGRLQVGPKAGSASCLDQGPMARPFARDQLNPAPTKPLGRKAHEGN